MNPGNIDSPFFSIYITHLPTSKVVVFRGWVTEFADNFTSTWQTQNVYGRMDPLATFENTQRQITIGFDVVSGDKREAADNLWSVNQLIEFLYPVYEHGPSRLTPDARTVQNTLKAGPLIGLRYANLIGNPLDGQKLVGYLAGVNYAPDMSKGGFMFGTQESYVTSDANEGNSTVMTSVGRGTPSGQDSSQTYDETRHGSMGYVPKVLNITLNYTVLHTHLTGWYQASETNYKFGGDDIDAKFPNNFVRKGRTEGRYDIETDEPTNVQVIQGLETDILGGG